MESTDGKRLWDADGAAISIIFFVSYSDALQIYDSLFVHQLLVYDIFFCCRCRLLIRFIVDLIVDLFFLFYLISFKYFIFIVDMAEPSTPSIYVSTYFVIILNTFSANDYCVYYCCFIEHARSAIVRGG